jgi:hypothetical protein
MSRFAQPMRARRATNVLLLGVFAVAGAILFTQFVAGFWTPLQPRRALVNASSFTFVAFALLAALNGRGSEPGFSKITPSYFVGGRFAALSVLGIAAAAAIGYLPSLADPFLFDDYTHLENAAEQSWSQVIANSLFVHPTAGDFFFRPVGYISYWLDFRWAGYDSWRWHLWNVSVHAVNSILVYVLGRQLRLSAAAALLAGLVFAIHGSHAEVTGWMAARFDLLAFLFSALTLIALNQFVECRKPAWFAAMVVTTALAVLSKEAAYCLPLVALAMIPFRRSAAASRAKLSGMIAAVCAIVFFYRSWFLGGVGGYQTENGAPAILNFHILGTANALFFRLWGLLLFPLNWSAPPGACLTLGCLLMLVIAALFLAAARANRAQLVGSLVLILAAALPVQHLLLIGPDFSGSRVLYLPTLGLAVFWGVLLQGCDKPRFALLLAAGLLLFQWGALRHNLGLRTEAARLSQRTCTAIGEELRRDARPILVEELPRTWKGVYFLSNGFIPCVTIESGAQQVAARLLVGPNLAAAAAPSRPRIFRWNAAARTLVESRTSAVQ